MKLQNVLIVYVFTPFALLMTGCSIFDGASGKKYNNVASSIAPEVAFNGANARRKPTQPRQSFEETGVENRLFRDVSAFELAYEVYVVQKGDTIYGIARKVKMSPATLMAVNGLGKDSKLAVGQRLKIEGGKSEWPSPVTTAKTTVYTVQAGDSLSKIAHAYGVTVKSLKAVNNLSSDKLIIGQKLTIPESMAKDFNANNSAGTQRVLDDDGKYTVKPGDNLTLIAKHFGIKQTALQEANNMDNPNKLRVGQKLVIPTKTAVTSDKTSSVKARKDNALVLSPQHAPKASKTSGDLYVIKSGDTIDKIARDLEVEKADLIKLNNLGNNSSLQEGKKLLIPQKKVVTEPKPPVAHTSEPRGEDFFENFEEIPVIEIKD
ncbi:MAG: LysM peptidoglycan-binding domain-containing protein [Puniceicoccales bacterium]|jgi:LysM repeat protein|nr:LysM peptidoglycan-binding domain-containing protein [Puniceicoccales bacterium]